MPLQRTLLRAMLWTLALAAGAGVLMIFVPGREVTGRLFGTGLLTAVAIALAMPMARLLDIERTRTSALSGLGVIVAAYATALLGVWIGLLSSNLDWRVSLTALSIAACGAVASVMVGLFATAAGRISAAAGLICTGATFLLLLSAIWAGAVGLGSWTEECGESAMHLAPMATLACACLFGVGTNRNLWTSVCLLGVAFTAAAFVMGMISVWIKPGGDATWFAQFLIVAVVIAHANLAIRIPVPPSQRWLSLGAVGAMLATAVCMSAINFRTSGFDQPPESDLLVRVAAACGIVTGCATLALVVLNRFNRRAGPVDSAPVSAFTFVLLACPRCREKQNAPIGTSGCTGCGLLLTVKVAEPRCPTCGYVTLDLKTTTCPECGGRLFPRGVAIPDQDPLGGALTPSARPSSAST